MFDSLFSYLASSPSHILIDGILIAFVLYLLLQKRYTPKNENRLSESVKKELIEEWKPEPLCPKEYKKWNHEPVTIESGDSVTCVVNGKEKINMVSTSFYALNSNKDIVENAKEAVRKYGVGSCGPRGFYGTFDVHLNLETALTKFLGTDGVLVYSSGYATNCSVIPAFSKRSDLIIYDESCCQSLQVGINLSRSRAMSFKHNDIKDLEAKLKKVELEDKAQNKKLYKKFVVVEGVYFNTGNICNLKEIFDLKERYKFRIIMDDSFGFGVLGKTGRGTPEHFGYKNTDVEIYMGNLGTVLGGVGGFCAGDTIVIHHQKLNAAGFVFSASSPPYLMSIANKSLDLISNNGKQYFDKFRDNLNLLRTQVTKQLGDHYNVHGNVSAPIIHLRLKNNLSNDENIALLEKIVSVSLEQGVLLANTKYVPMDFNPPAPSIRLTVTSEHSAGQIETAVSTLLSATKQVLGN